MGLMERDYRMQARDARGAVRPHRAACWGAERPRVALQVTEPAGDADMPVGAGGQPARVRPSLLGPPAAPSAGLRGSRR